VPGSTFRIDDERKAYIKNALKERVSLRAICRIFGVSLSWLMSFAKKVWKQTPDDLGAQRRVENDASPEKLQLLGIQMDEMWSFVQNKGDKAWIWVAYEPVGKQVIATHIGKRDEAGFLGLWQQLPEAWREHCDFETDHWSIFKSYIPPARHYPTKALTFWIESFFGRVRARVSRLVRKNRAFSKTWENHRLAIRYFFWQSNLEMASLHL
jgi:IS1 family transposase